MRILLIAATSFEIKDFIKHNSNVEVLICGIGSPATIYHLTKKLLQDKYDLVIQAGIAGSFSKKIKRGQVVLVKRDVFADVGVEEQGTFNTIFKLGFADENSFPFNKGWLINSHPVLRSTNLKIVSAATINKLSDRRKQSRQIKKVFHPDIETMEGAALHYVCLQMQIPYLQIRSISNKVGERNKHKWKINKAIGNLNIEVIKLLQTLALWK